MLKVTGCSFTANFEFEIEGGISMIIGPNGAGKTTFLKTISGRIKPPLCKIILDGEDISHLPTSEIIRKGIVLVPSGKANFPELTVEENLRLGMYVGKIKAKKEIFEDIYSLFPVLKERRKQIAGTLSGGEQKMLAIARGLAANPKILLLDEPSFGLAPKVIESIYESFKKIKDEGTSIIISEQGISVALGFKDIIDQVYFIIDHKFTFKGRIDELEKIEDVRRVYFGV